MLGPEQGNRIMCTLAFWTCKYLPATLPFQSLSHKWIDFRVIHIRYIAIAAEVFMRNWCPCYRCYVSTLAKKFQREILSSDDGEDPHLRLRDRGTSTRFALSTSAL